MKLSEESTFFVKLILKQSALNLSLMNAIGELATGEKKEALDDLNKARDMQDAILKSLDEVLK